MRLVTTAVGLCLCISALAYGAAGSQFRAHSEGDSVHLEWTATTDAGVSAYEVYRQDYPTDDFDKLVSLPPTAQARYRYLDQNVYREVAARGPVVYRLAVRTITGSHTYQAAPAFVQEADENLMARSWDTIKLMFR